MPRVAASPSPLPVAAIPAASEVESETESVAPAVDMESLISQLKQLEATDLFKVMKQALAEAEKRSKGTTSRVAASKKKGSMPPGAVPRQLLKPREWVKFTLKHALENGWESFTVYQDKKDKETGDMIEEEIEMPGSTLHEGAHVYEGSVTEKNPQGKQLIMKDAMSLSKQRWSEKRYKDALVDGRKKGLSEEETMEYALKVGGTHRELYAEFEAQYVEELPADDTSSETSSTKRTVVRKTAAEKAAEAEEKKAAKEAEKAEKKAAKEAEKAEKKAEKEAEKAAAKAEKEALKAAAKAEKEAAKKPGSKVVPAKAVAAPAKAVAAPVKAVAAPVKATPVKAKAVAAPKAEEWSCPADGMCHHWAYKGKQYLRNSDNEVWLKGADGGLGAWQGVYIVAEDRIDDSVEEPVFDDEE
jgi:hypothetical protein